ncbi:MAG: hypothetical protein E7632_04745 [Ruminococcaceae bacterium]|nr:hypothetical protein [Oscillospiraceae bacterium]
MLYFVFTGMHASNGALGSRIKLLLPNTMWYFDTFLPDLLRQIGAAFLKGGTRTLFVGFARGVSSCFTSLGGVLCLIGAAAVGGGVYLAVPHSMEKNTGQRAGVWVWGILLFLAPLAPYFVIENPWFSLRATVPSFVGAGLLIDAALRLITRRERIFAIVCASLTAICLVAGFSEVSDYHRMGEYDNALSAQIRANADQMSGRVGILGVEERPLAGNYGYHEHVASVGSSDWALYGKLVADGKAELTHYYPVPLALEGFSYYVEWNRESKRISGFEQIWLWNPRDMTLVRMNPIESAPEDYLIYDPSGTLWGRIFEENGYRYVSVADPEEK